MRLCVCFTDFGSVNIFFFFFAAVGNGDGSDLVLDVYLQKTNIFSCKLGKKDKCEVTTGPACLYRPVFTSITLIFFPWRQIILIEFISYVIIYRDLSELFCHMIREFL